MISILTIVPKTIKKRIMNKINLTEMKRKDYLKPTMKVVKLQHTGMLMVSGQVQATRDSYGDATVEEWE